MEFMINIRLKNGQHILEWCNAPDEEVPPPDFEWAETAARAAIWYKKNVDPDADIGDPEWAIIPATEMMHMAKEFAKFRAYYAERLWRGWMRHTYNLQGLVKKSAPDVLKNNEAHARRRAAAELKAMGVDVDVRFNSDAGQADYVMFCDEQDTRLQAEERCGRCRLWRSAGEDDGFRCSGGHDKEGPPDACRAFDDTGKSMEERVQDMIKRCYGCRNGIPSEDGSEPFRCAKKHDPFIEGCKDEEK